MKVVVALDSFKGSLSAKAACRTVVESLRALQPDWSIEGVPLADGGEGTAEALVDALRGQWRPVSAVSGPLPGMRLDASFGWLPSARVAVVEMASASGLTLVPRLQRNPLLTTTYGTGQLLAAARDAGARRILLTLGGSATVDGGTGAARALGWRFYDAAGRQVPDGGGSLRRIAVLQPPQQALPPIEAWYDVRNPLCGEHGAARVYGPQKGATAAMVAELEAGLRHLADLVQHQLGIDLLDLPGGGAAGGFGAGARAFFGAQLVPGAQGVMKAVGLKHALAGADWVVAGEGCLDNQSLQGKVVGEVARLARHQRVKVAVLAGRVLLEPAQLREAGFEYCEQTMSPGMSLAQAMDRAESLLAAATGRLATRIC